MNVQIESSSNINSILALDFCSQFFMCDPNAIKWIEVAFNDCIVTVRDKWSFGIGLLSTIVFLVSSIPQIVLNFKQKKVDGQSPFFFSLLFAGSVSNLIGVLITHGLITQIIQAICYCALDGILFGQFIVYKYIIKSNDEAKESTTTNIADIPATQTETESQNDDGAISTGGMAMAALVSAGSATDWAKPYQKDQLIGSVFGWIATVIFTSSRFPQIIKNAKDKAVDNLSPFYFILSISGNLTYSISVFLRSIESDYLWKQAPFLAGSIGPLACDLIVLFQMLYYKARNQTVSSSCQNEEEKYVSNDDEVRRAEEL